MKGCIRWPAENKEGRENGAHRNRKGRVGVLEGAMEAGGGVARGAEWPRKRVIHEHIRGGGRGRARTSRKLRRNGGHGERTMVEGEKKKTLRENG